MDLPQYPDAGDLVSWAPNGTTNYRTHLLYMCKTPVIHMFHICNIGVHPTNILYVYNYMCNTGLYSTPVLHV